MNAHGTAWFSDFKIEEGVTDTTNTWNFLCLIFDYVDVDINDQNIKLTLTSIDKDDMVVCMRRFQQTMKELSKNKMNVNYDIQEISTPIKHFSYDEETGYYVSGYDINDVLDPYIEKGIYDHVFVVFRTGSINAQGAIPTNDWIGLGYMEYRNIGFSNIRLPDDDSSYLYKYDSRINMFPEEVMVHEFLHTLERNAEEYGKERPALHDYLKFGYKDEKLYGQLKWYEDYMNGTIKTDIGYAGLPEDIYTKKPSKTTDFTYSHQIKAFSEPKNIIEEIHNIFNRIKNLFVTIQTQNGEEK